LQEYHKEAAWKFVIPGENVLVSDHTVITILVRIYGGFAAEKLTPADPAKLIKVLYDQVRFKGTLVADRASLERASIEQLGSLRTHDDPAISTAATNALYWISQDAQFPAARQLAAMTLALAPSSASAGAGTGAGAGGGTDDQNKPVVAERGVMRFFATEADFATGLGISSSQATAGRSIDGYGQRYTAKWPMPSNMVAGKRLPHTRFEGEPDNFATMRGITFAKPREGAGAAGATGAVRRPAPSPARPPAR
jgi:hypothetical protein